MRCLVRQISEKSQGKTELCFRSFIINEARLVAKNRMETATPIDQHSCINRNS